MSVNEQDLSSQGSEAGQCSPELVLFDKDRTLLIPWGATEPDPAILPLIQTERVLRFSSRRRMGFDEAVLRGGTVEFLERLRSAGIPCGIVTRDFEEATQELLDIAGLRGFFHEDAILTRDARINHKPHSDHFLRPVQTLGLDPTRCIMVGDDIWDDIWGAREAGLKTVLARYWRYSSSYMGSVEPDLTISHFDELTPSVLGSLIKPPTGLAI